eukprot:31550-Pelagococcus_subviridis.AAC.22
MTTLSALATRWTTAPAPPPRARPSRRRRPAPRRRVARGGIMEDAGVTSADLGRELAPKLATVASDAAAAAAASSDFSRLFPDLPSDVFGVSVPGTAKAIADAAAPLAKDAYAYLPSESQGFLERWWSEEVNSGFTKARSPSHRSPYDPVGVVNAVPRGRTLLSLPARVSLRPSPLAFDPDTPRRLSTPLLTPFNSAPTSLHHGQRRVRAVPRVPRLPVAHLATGAHPRVLRRVLRERDRRGVVRAEVQRVGRPTKGKARRRQLRPGQPRDGRRDRPRARREERAVGAGRRAAADRGGVHEPTRPTRAARRAGVREVPRVVRRGRGRGVAVPGVGVRGRRHAGGADRSEGLPGVRRGGDIRPRARRERRLREAHERRREERAARAAVHSRRVARHRHRAPGREARESGVDGTTVQARGLRSRRGSARRRELRPGAEPSGSVLLPAGELHHAGADSRAAAAATARGDVRAARVGGVSAGLVRLLLRGAGIPSDVRAAAAGTESHGSERVVPVEPRRRGVRSEKVEEEGGASRVGFLRVGRRRRARMGPRVQARVQAEFPAEGAVRVQHRAVASVLLDAVTWGGNGGGEGDYLLYRLRK